MFDGLSTANAAEPERDRRADWTEGHAAAPIGGDAWAMGAADLDGVDS